MGGMAESSVIKSKMLDKYGTPVELPKKPEATPEAKEPEKEETTTTLMAEGGEVEVDDDQDEEQHSSITAAIMAKKQRKMMAEGGEVTEVSPKETTSELNDVTEAGLKENPDSDLESDEPEETDMISKIRSKMRMKMGK